jgi:asparagine synthase (glutamine-hydrolysing)
MAAVCGICGVVALDRPAEVETVARMRELLAHRGPDGDGEWHADGVALGHRRLSIIDLSDAGLQPFANEDGSLQLVHNGEIYNYLELRAELEAKGHRFRSATDTEVVLAGYREWGEACVEHFNGMWAFAIWDAPRRRLFCSRDRFGVKPFYYSLAGGRFTFASELKAFRADPSTPLRPNERAVRDFLQQGYVDHMEETFFAGILQLLPAHSLSFGEDGLTVRRYWALERRDPPGGDAVAAVRETFLDSIRLQLRSDVPIGTCLSGGLDSSAIACTVAHLLRTETGHDAPIGERQQTFTAYFEDRGFDERPFAEAVVGRTGAQPHWISFDAPDLVANLPRIVESQDEPFGSTSMVAQWYVMQEAARSGMKVMLDGQGSDEIFAGYHGYFGPFFADLLVRGRIETLSREVRAYRSLHGASVLYTAVSTLRPFVPDRLRWAARGRVKGGGALVHPELRRLGSTPELNGVPFADRLRRQLHLILTERGLPELLRYEDRNSMAHSLEARVPFLDHRLAELLFSLPGDQLIQNGMTKSLLRRALADILPPPVRDRVDKLGFVTPEGRWLRGALGDLAADTFASQSFRERGWVDAAAARRRLDAHRAGELNAGFELWRAVNLELWAQAFLDA